MKTTKPKTSRAVVETEPNGAAMALIMEKMASRQALSEIIDPSAWQREIRKETRSCAYRQ